MNNPKSAGRWPSDGYRKLKFCDQLMTGDPISFKNAKYDRENV